MDLTDLRVFKTVVQEDGVTRAARRLHRVQSNITTRIRQLEEDLDVKLFIREGKRLHLAPAGEILLDYAERILALADEAREAVEDSAPKGPFRIGAMESTAAVRLPDVLTAYHGSYPNVVLELSTGNPIQLARELREGHLHAAFFAEPVEEGGLESVVAFREEVVVITAKDQLRISNAGSVPQSTLVFEQGCPHRRRLEVWLTSMGGSAAQVIELRSYHAMLGCVVAGMGAALLPRSMLRTFPHQDKLRVHPLPKQLRMLDTHLAWRRGARSAKVNALLDVLNAIG